MAQCHNRAAPGYEAGDILEEIQAGLWDQLEYGAGRGVLSLAHLDNSGPLIITDSYGKRWAITAAPVS